MRTRNADGSKSVELSEVDQMYGTRGKMTFTIYPDKAYIEIKGQLYNRTNLPQTFLWWANPAAAVNDNTQSVFPPDATAVYDHGKRDVSAFPIATGVYYKHDYSAGVDISRYKSIPVPTSYMCAGSDNNFVGGYDYGVEADILHIADHHVSPGKKQWTWGNGDFGQALDRNLTDANGPCIELMTGMYCDNQPDITWLKPYGEKTFTQYFMPYKNCGYVKNASRECVPGLKVAQGKANVTVYTTQPFKAARGADRRRQNRAGQNLRPEPRRRAGGLRGRLPSRRPATTTSPASTASAANMPWRWSTSSTAWSRITTTSRRTLKGMILDSLGREVRALSRFHKLISYAEKHYCDEVKIDYFAVSLPDLQLFDEDLTIRNRAHCEYLIALGSYGLGDMVRAKNCYDAMLAIDCGHQGAVLHRQLL